MSEAALQREDLAQPTDPIGLKPDMTLSEILKLMKAVDEGMAELSEDEMRELARKQEIKVDAYRYMITKYEAEAKRLEGEAKPFIDAARTFWNKAAAVEKIMIYHFQEHRLKKMPGEKWKASLRASKSVKPKLEADASIYLRYSNYMRIGYEWDKKKIAVALKAEDPAIKAIAEFQESPWIKFDPNKQVDDDE